jgi:integrase
MSLKNKNFTLAKLQTCRGDLKKQWFVSYFFRNPKTDKKVRFKESEGINKFHTAKERTKAGNDLIVIINEKLKTGYNPFNEAAVKQLPQVVSISELPKSSVKFLEAYDHVVSVKKNTTARDTYRTYYIVRKYLVIFLQKSYTLDIQLSALSKAFFAEFKNFLLSGEPLNQKKKKLSAKTINNYIVCVHAIFSELIAEEKLEKNPCQVKKVKGDSLSGVPFSKEHAKLVLQQCKEDDKQLLTFIQFIYYTLNRPNALRSLKVGDIDLEKKTIRFNSSYAKNRKTGHVLISNAFFKVISDLNLKNYPDDFYIFGHHGVPSLVAVSKNFFWEKHYDILKDLDLYKYRYSLYCWKHTGAVALYEAIKDIKRVSEQCLHSSVLVTMTYLRNMGVVFGNDDLVNMYPELEG